MDRGHAVGAVRADDGQVGHAHLALAALLDQAHARHAAVVAGVARADVVEEAAVDLVDDLQVPRQHQLEQADRPVLQRLGQQRVVGVGQRPPRQVPGLVPAELRLVEQDPHQLGDGQRGMRVVELDGDLVGQRAASRCCRRRKRRTMSASEQATRKYSWTKRRPWPRGRVVGIEDARQRLGGHLLGDGAEEVAAAELREVEVVRRGRRPQPQRVDRLAAVADHRPIVGDADQRRGPFGTTAAAAAASRTTQLSGTSTVSSGPGDLPRVGPAQPVVRLLDLPAVLDLLPEDAVLVAQAVADRRDLQRGQRVDEAGGQPAEAAVAQARRPAPARAAPASRAARASSARWTSGSSSRLVMLLASDRPIRNSIER